MTAPIHTLDWRGVALHSGVLREWASEQDRLIVWLPTDRDGSCQYWQRISTVSRAVIVQHEGLSTIAATAIQARQRARGILSGFLRRFHRVSEDLAWVLPNGETVQQCGGRQTDLLLVWSDEHSQQLDEKQIHEHWSQARVFNRSARTCSWCGAWQHRLPAPEPRR